MYTPRPCLLPGAVNLASRQRMQARLSENLHKRALMSCLQPA